MRTAKEIEQLAKDGKLLPQFADPAEEYYYDTIQIGLWKYQHKEFTREELLKFRNKKRRIYEHLLQQFKLAKTHNDLAVKLSQVHLCGCEKCKEIAKILEGRASCE